jgi:hypothetical protein
MNDDALRESLRQAWLAGFGWEDFAREHAGDLLGSRDDAMKQDIEDILKEANSEQLP